MDGNAHPALMFRGGETVVEKFLAHWLSSLLHSFVVVSLVLPIIFLVHSIRF